MDDGTKLQRAYYQATAAAYDRAHVDHEPEHDRACDLLVALCREHRFRTVLDVGSGTGRVPLHLAASAPELEVLGLEPVAELRAIGHRKGLPADRLVAGDATSLPFADGSFDVVCACGVLHHVAEPRRVIDEMLRVARHGILLSDSNRYGHGSRFARHAKLWLQRAGLWRLADRVRTRGKGYHLTPGDGLIYSYSLFDDRAHIARACRSVTIVPLDGAPGDPRLEAQHLVLTALK